MRVYTTILFFYDTATTVIYTLSLHERSSDLPDSQEFPASDRASTDAASHQSAPAHRRSEEHTSELQSLTISYAVFCLKKTRARKKSAPRTRERAPRTTYAGRPCASRSPKAIP